LHTVLSTLSATLQRLAIHGILRRHRLTISFTAPSAGTLSVGLRTASRHATVLAAGSFAFHAAGSHSVTLLLTKTGRSVLRHAHRVKALLSGTFAQSGAAAATVTLGLTIAR